MRLIKFLQERVVNKVETEIPENMALKWLKTKAKKNWEIVKNLQFLWRGNNDLDANKIYYFSGTIERKSADTSNHYTLLLSQGLNSWKSVPRRDMSLICTTSCSYADTYGFPWVVIPLDSSKSFAVSQTPDFWNCLYLNDVFQQIDVKTFEELVWVFRTFADENNFLDFLRNNKINSFTNELEKKFNFWLYIGSCAIGKRNSFLADNALTNKYSSKAIDFYEQNSTELNKFSLMQLLDKVLTPESVKLKVVSNFIELKKYFNQEIWFDKPALLMTVGKIKSINNII